MFVCVILQLNAVIIFQRNLPSPAQLTVLSLSSPCSPWTQSGRTRVRDRCRFTGKQLPASSKPATEWETLPPTPQTPAASAGAAAVAAPGNNTLLPTHAGLEIWETRPQAERGPLSELWILLLIHTVRIYYYISVHQLNIVTYWSPNRKTEQHLCLAGDLLTHTLILKHRYDENSAHGGRKRQESIEHNKCYNFKCATVSWKIFFSLFNHYIYKSIHFNISLQMIHTKHLCPVILISSFWHVFCMF